MTHRAVTWARSRRAQEHVLEAAARAAARDNTKRAAAIARAKAAEQEKAAER